MWNASLSPRTNCFLGVILSEFGRSDEQSEDIQRDEEKAAQKVKRAEEYQQKQAAMSPEALKVALREQASLFADQPR